jgi:cytidylate kinase
MSGESGSINQMRAVTISREYGSGGGEIAKRLAERLGWHLVDHEVVVQVARELGVSEEEAAARDEHVESLLSRILTSMQGIAPAVYPAIYDENTPVALFTNPEEYREAVNRVIKGAFAVGHVVIVGRGAQVVLGDRRDVLHVRIVASLERRIPYVMRREGLDEHAARSRIQSKDHDRERYLQTEYRRHPADAHLYDLVVNTDVLDLDSVVDLIVLALERKARRLNVPERELGPGAGLAPYSGRPGDLRPPYYERASDKV